ncbi:MAG TPA: tRNA (guanosine(37)-N1)-methyltransferase TrmD [candidate division Zixibacteria bacterium]|nr:tRNA (guanosine(37)-N1)-methyltransferase TrmD [candidate division Zixibacteria bacterium]
MRIDIITIFPNMVDYPLSDSLIGRGRENGIFEIKVHDLRDFTTDKHKVVDDIPYGGGPGMVMKPEPIVEAVRSIDPDHKAMRLITSAGGELFSQKMATDLAKVRWILIICGHYKGVDQRAVEIAHLREVSIGDYVLTGGEYAAVVMADAILRLIPGTMNDFGSAVDDSHFTGLLGPEEYTRPEVFEGIRVPDVLISGHHENIRKWRFENAISRTQTRRPDLLQGVEPGQELKNKQIG